MASQYDLKDRDPKELLWVALNLLQNRPLDFDPGEVKTSQVLEFLNEYDRWNKVVAKMLSELER